ncbi:hypothetical protein AVEN_35662-1 [Araneus ventricosus]|uniref:Uncharacterized protein n=1 Tax=Araneus ventricosus TaxID=182803 RepID=A0A4Y2GDB4_ARAVE|nr:hypothetical protein AVEN_35662-1 [Araneus ventricosus]
MEQRHFETRFGSIFKDNGISPSSFVHDATIIRTLNACGMPASNKEELSGSNQETQLPERNAEDWKMRGAIRWSTESGWSSNGTQIRRGQHKPDHGQGGVTFPFRPREAWKAEVTRRSSDLQS